MILGDSTVLSLSNLYNSGIMDALRFKWLPVPQTWAMVKRIVASDVRYEIYLFPIQRKCKRDIQ